MPGEAPSAGLVHIPGEALTWATPRRWTTLEKLCVGIFDCPHSTPELSDNGPFVVRSQDIRTGTFRADLAARVTNETYRERIARAEPSYGDVLYSREGTYFGIAAQVPKHVQLCLGQRMVLIRPARSLLRSRFLTYWLNSPVMARHVHGFRDGTVAERLNMPTIRRLPIPLFDPQEQQRIEEILGALDDKIELNRQMSETLEAMARALFKSWFVDFDPVRAKAKGRDPGFPKHVSDHFPARLVLSEIGDIPEGWPIGRLDDALILQRGFDLPTLSRSEGRYPVLAASGPSGFHNEHMVRGPGVTTGRSGVLGQVFFIHDDFWPLNTSLWVREFKRSTPAYAFHLLRGLDFESFNAGSAVPTLNRNHVHNLPVLMPPIALVEAFDAAAMRLLQRQRCADQESASLAALRDALLPKLISGELRVKAAERLVADAAA